MGVGVLPAAFIGAHCHVGHGLKNAGRHPCLSACGPTPPRYEYYAVWYYVAFVGCISKIDSYILASLVFLVNNKDKFSVVKRKTNFHFLSADKIMFSSR